MIMTSLVGHFLFQNVYFLKQIYDAFKITVSHYMNVFSKQFDIA